MADRSTLLRKPGILSGRLKPRGWTPPDGEYVVVLGSDLPGYTGRFQSGNGSSLETDGDVVSNVVASFRARLRGTVNPLPSGWSWVLQFSTSGTLDVVQEFVLDAGVQQDLLDLAIPLTTVDDPGTLMLNLIAVGPDDDAVAELEIPAVYLDTFVVSSIVAGYGIFNRLPAPASVNVSRTRAITFSVLSTTGTAPNTDSVTIFVDDFVIMTGGVVAAGWTVDTEAVGDAGSAFVVTPPAIWGSLASVSVRVVIDEVPIFVESAWSFTTADETAPRLLTGSSPAHDRIRLRFDEAVWMGDGTDERDALNPLNWTASPLDAPAVTVRVVTVIPISAFEVELVLDIPLSQGTRYLVTASGVTDVVGNPIEEPDNEVIVVAFECERPAGRAFALWLLLAETDRRRDTTRDLYKFMAVLQEPTDLLLCDIDRWTDILDPDIAEERYLDQMLLTLGNPFDFDLAVVDKRRLIRSLVRVYQLKGTAVGIISVIRFFLGLEVTIRPYNQDGWILGVSTLGFDTFLYSSERFARYSFVVVAGQILTDEQRRWIDELVDYMKPAHTHHIRAIEPETPDETGDHWILGVSELGIDTILGSLPEPGIGFPYTFPFVLS